MKVLDFSQSKSKFSCRHCTYRELCLPGGLEPSAIEYLETVIGTPHLLRRGEHLYKRGDSLDALYIVKSGSIKVYSTMANGDEQIAAFHLPGELIGLDALGTGVHGCSVAALETTSVCELPILRLENMCRLLPALRRQLHRLMGKHVSHNYSMQVLLGKRSAEERVAAFLLSLSARLKARRFSAHEFNLSMSRHDIANHLGLAAETISRMFSRFQDDGLVSVQAHHICIHDRDRLHARVSANAALTTP